MLYVVLALLVVVVLYFVLGRKSEAAPPPAAPAPRPEAQKAPAAKKEPDRKAEPQAPPPAAEPVAAPRDPSKPPAAAEPAPEPPKVEKPVSSRALFSKRADVGSLRRGLSKSRDEQGFFGKLRTLFAARAQIDEGIAKEIEEVLLASDVGVKTTTAILERVREALGKGEHVDPARVWEVLREEARRILEVDGKARSLELRAKPTVVLFVGVNGAGKTTTIGKLATKMKDEGLTPVLAAGDTFRAAAVQQLGVWGTRVGCEVVRGKDGADPGSVVFDAVQKAIEKGADVVLADTAGRLHTKTNLMAEMQKIARTTGKALEGAPHEVLLVIDATNGQNAMAQAQEFKAALDLTGIVLTKLDGTAKGGVVLGIANELGLPVRFVGLGERPDDLHEFSPNDFVEALLGKEVEAGAA